MPDSAKITLSFSELNQGAGENDNYKVYRAAGQDPCPNNIVDVSNLIDTKTSTGGGTFTYVDTSVAVGTAYFYRLSTVRDSEEVLGNLIGPLVSRTSNDLAYPGGPNDNSGSPYYVTKQPLLHINADHEYKKHGELTYGNDTELTIENTGNLPDILAHNGTTWNGTVKLDDGFGSGHSSFAGNSSYATNLPMLTSNGNIGASYFSRHRGGISNYHIGDYNKAFKKNHVNQHVYLDRGVTFFIVYKGWISTNGYWHYGSRWLHSGFSSFIKESDGEPWYLGKDVGDQQYALIGDGTNSETWNNFNNTDINGSNQVVPPNNFTFRNGSFRPHPGGNDSWAPPSSEIAGLGRYATLDGSAGVGRQADGHIAYAGSYAQPSLSYPSGAYSLNDEWKTKWHVMAYTTSPNSLAQGGGSAIGAWFDGNMFTDFHNAYNYFPYNGTGLTNIFDTNTNSLSCSQANFPADATKDWRNLQANLTTKHSTVGEHIMRSRPIDAIPTDFMYGSNGSAPGLVMCIGDMIIFPSALSQADFMTVIDYINNKYSGHLFTQGSDYIPTSSHSNAWFTKG
jgi:hypothetical protein